MDPNFLVNLQRTVDKQKKNIEITKLIEYSQTSRSASPATIQSSTSRKSAEKSKIRGFFRQWCPTDLNSVPGAKVDQSSGYFTYKLKEEPKPIPQKPQKKRCARQPHLEALVEE